MSNNKYAEYLGLIDSLGNPRIPIETWSDVIPFKQLVQVTGELIGTGDRLKTPRFQRIIQKLRHAGIYVKYHSGPVPYENHGEPLSEDDKTCGMQSSVRISYHPNNYKGPVTLPGVGLPEPPPKPKTQPPPPAFVPSSYQTSALYPEPEPIPAQSVPSVVASSFQPLQALPSVIGAVSTVTGVSWVTGLKIQDKEALKQSLLKLQECLATVSQELQNTIQILEGNSTPLAKPEPEISDNSDDGRDLGVFGNMFDGLDLELDDDESEDDSDYSDDSEVSYTSEQQLSADNL